jgi:hypothetical protein
MFLNLIGSFTPWHLKLLKFFQRPDAVEAAKRKADSMMAGGFSIVLEAAYPEIQGRREFYDLIVKDLHGNGLLGTDTVHAMVSARGLLEKRTTAFGDRFLAFIEAPPELAGGQADQST